jgi:transcriptional regulator with XRE-family HTH domain
MAIGDRVREARDSKGLTQPQLSHQSGVSERALRDIESGTTKNPSTATVKRLASVLGVPPEVLMGDEPIERPAPKARPAAAAGHRSAREAVADEAHYLQYLFKRAGLVSEEQQRAAAAKLDERYRQFETVTPALVDLWLESYVRDLPAMSRKTGRGVAR